VALGRLATTAGEWVATMSCTLENVVTSKGSTICCRDTWRWSSGSSMTAQPGGSTLPARRMASAGMINEAHMKRMLETPSPSSCKPTTRPSPRTIRKSKDWR
jgi:hypothetical protein